MSLGDFSQQAGAYAAARPSYPPALVDCVLEVAGVRAGDTVADLGAGTGIFTRLLAERRLRVTAVEPNDAMRRQAADLPGVTWVKGTFEETTLADASQRWVVAAQAFHWADPPQALPEIRRILEPEGRFTALWNNRLHEEHPVLKWTQQAIRRRVPDFDELYRDRPWDAVLTSTGDFTKVVYREERHTTPMTRERYLTLWRSHNRLNAIAGAERFQDFLAELTEYLESLCIEVVEVPYLCRAWTVE